MKKFFWAVTLVSILLILSIAVFYAFFGHQLIEAMYQGEAPGILNKVMRERSHTLEYYLDQGDWLAIGAPVTIGILWLLTAIVMIPAALSAFFERLHAKRGALLALSSLFLGLALLIPSSIEPLALVRLLATWLALTTALFSRVREFSIARLGEIAASTTILVLFIFCVFFLIRDPLFL